MRRFVPAEHRIVVGAFLALFALAPGLEVLAQPSKDGGQDSDGDGVVDTQDLCPREVGLASSGCPPLDTDGDGLVDALDACDDDPGPQATGGCPDSDRDGDGIADRVDRCIDVVGVAAHEGCPAPDQDGDWIVDSEDRCPTRPESYNGRKDDDGCPDAGAALLHPEGERLVLALTLKGRPRPSKGLRRSVRLAEKLLRSRGVEALEVVVVSAGGSSPEQSLLLAQQWATIASEASQTHAAAVALAADGAPRIFLRAAGTK